MGSVSEAPTADAQVCYVSGPADVTAARRKARLLASATGFAEAAAEQIALVVSELGSNLHKHAGGGILSVQAVAQDGRRGIRIEARDRGPGIAQPEQAMVDGYSTAGTLGDGLGAVNRLVDALEIASDGSSGTHVVACKWLWEAAPAPAGTPENPYDCGAASRAHPEMTVNGDAFFIKHWPGHSLVAVIDGVGHGQFAHRAARASYAYLENHYRLPVDELFTGVARACLGSRGAVMAIAALDWHSRNIAFASVGNIETRLFNASRDKLFPVRRGIVGMQMPKPRVSTEQWERGGVLVMQSDGISTRWPLTELNAMLHLPASAIARRILNRHGKEQDDATVAVIKDRRTDA